VRVLSHQTKKRTIWTLCIVAAFLVGWFVLAWAGAKFLIVKSEISPADAIVVLSGSATYLERTAHAGRIYREGGAPIVILTNDGLLGGWNNKEQRNLYFYELAMRELERQGVPDNRIQIVSGQAAGTFEEATRVREFAASHNLKRLLIVTSAYHSRRALWSMRRACEGSGIEVGIDSAPPGWQTPSPWVWWSKRWGWKIVGGEYVKLIYYWTKY